MGVRVRVRVRATLRARAGVPCPRSAGVGVCGQAFEHEGGGGVAQRTVDNVRVALQVTM